MHRRNRQRHDFRNLRRMEGSEFFFQCGIPTCGEL
jgi:hypothetical protein